MKPSLAFVIALAGLCLTGCASSSIKKTWKSSTYHGGPLKKVAVIGVDERGMVRKGIENRFVRDLGAHGQSAAVTYELMSLPDIKADKEAAVRALQSAGADSVLIVRLVDQTSYSRQIEARPEVYVPVTTGIDTSYTYGWYDYYTVAFMDMGASWGTTTQEVYLDSSLYDLTTGRRLWSALTLTKIKEGDDRLVVVDQLTSKVVGAMRKSGMVN